MHRILSKNSYVFYINMHGNSESNVMRNFTPLDPFRSRKT